ncbi:dihydrofolate reductase [Paenibacillus polymyxa]|uniref:Dihydrofolate reductase n=1 Tax=Paenibacillus polymyxa TaxID=1406 RepID=A0A378XZA5_PAEPO|nr:dihydrofolate reductase [Paenibacillus polymyxa]MBE7896075.1 dihydrofolate reductase [Paenibacillus polymyxa]MBG9765970.1 dihydrofolate reductase [Paenibacillus polymyxa]MCC3256612.1 dihydrofolate reductase [Paenibacillus polymyxa]QPK54903.1 dihydrofolate reductase [Paenibacillus polymyxa]QPK59991.1 dihydrofolate reductase [Paenibacillus polymyxa]
MSIIIIAALDKNGLIGNGNRLPWKIKADMDFFKAQTTGNNVVMGRKTYESIGKPLNNRTNIILTKNMKYKANGCEVFNNIDDILKFAKESSKETFIIGGKEVYELFIPYSDKMILTHIEGEFSGDTFFPLYDHRRWREINCIEVEAEESSGYPIRIVHYEVNK